MRGITTGCLSYALKGKLPAGLCLIIIGTEGSAGGGCVESGLIQRATSKENGHPRGKLTLAGSRRADRITSWLQDAVIKIGSALSEPDDLEYEEFWCPPR
jgi:hypothetical protein